MIINKVIHGIHNIRRWFWNPRPLGSLRSRKGISWIAVDRVKVIVSKYKGKKEEETWEESCTLGVVLEKSSDGMVVLPRKVSEPEGIEASLFFLV